MEVFARLGPRCRFRYLHGDRQSLANAGSPPTGSRVSLTQYPLRAHRRLPERRAQAHTPFLMSDTTETADRRLREDSPAVRAVCEQVEQIIGGPETDLAVAFAEIFLSRAPQELLQERSTLDLTHMVVGAYRFFAEARPDRVDVVVSNADPDGNGDRAPVTTVRTNVSERPFIVDTIREFLHSQQLLISQIVYPLFEIDRDEHGHMTAVRPPGDSASKESLVHCEVARVDDPERLDESHPT